MMKAFSFLTILESLSKKLSILRTKMHSDNLRVDYESITSQLRVSRPFLRTSLTASSGASFALSRRVSHFAAILTILFTVGVGNVWGEIVLFEPTDKTITSGNITVSTGNTTPSELTIAGEKTNGWKIDSKGTITISSTLPNIKSITILGCTSTEGTGKELCGDVKVSLDGETFSTITSGVTIVDADGTQTTGAGFALVKKGNKPACTMTITFDNTQRYVQISRAASNGKQMNIASISVEKVELQTYDITYQSNGGTTIPKTEGAVVIPYSLSVPTKDGCVFVGWYTDSDLTIAAVSGTVLVDNIVLYAKWIEAEEKCITFGSKANISNGTTTTSLDDMTIESSGIDENCTKLGNTSDFLTIQLKNNTFLKCFKIYAYSSNGLKIWFSETNTFEDDPLIISLPTNYGWTQVFDIPEDIAYVKIQRENGSVYFTQICLGIVEEQSCTAPTSVSVSGSWDRFGGETISLTATATGGSGNYTYQWQKYYGSTWNNITDNATATTANLVYENCDGSHSGTYRCVVSTGTDCSTASAGLQVKVYTLECYTNGTNIYHFTRNGNTQSGTLTLDLNANTAYKFKVHVDNTYYGNNGTINKDETNWVMCNSDNGGDCANNLTVNSGLGGTFTFGIEYSTGGNSSVEGEPEISVTYPRKTIYLVPNSDWLSNSAKFAYYYFHKTGDDTDAEGWTDFLTADDCGRYADIPQWNGVQMIAVRFNPSDATPGWNGNEHVWNQTGDIAATADKNCVTITGWNTGTYGTYSTPTYTISYNAGTGGSGSKPNETKTCGVDFTLPNSAVFTRTGYTQTGWTTSDGGSQTHALGGSYTTNAAQTFYPVWTVNSYQTTTTFTNVSMTGEAPLNQFPNTLEYGSSLNRTFVANTGYRLPETITVTGATYTWDSSTGVLSITNVTGEVSVTITGIQNTYTITYNINRPTQYENDEKETDFPAETTVTVNAGGTITLPNPSIIIDTNPVYTAKWKDASDNEYSGGAEITPTGDMTLTAQWTPQSWPIRYYESFDGTNLGNEITGLTPDQYTYGVETEFCKDEAAIVQNANKTGYTWLGWWNRWDIPEPQNPITKATAGYSGEFSLFAKWEENTPVTPPTQGDCWNISDDAFVRLLGSITANQIVNGLNIVATSSKNVQVEENEQVFDGYTFTHRLKLNGTGDEEYRHLKFAVTGTCTIDVYLMSGSSDKQRTLNVDIGSFGTDVTGLVAGTTIAKQTYEYRGGATDIYMYSANSGINIYQICVTYPATPTPEPGAETCIALGSDNSKDIKSDGTATVGNYTITASKVNWQSDNAKLDNDPDYIVFTNSTGIIAANITAKNNAVVVIYSSSIDGTTNVTTEEVAATDRFAELTLNVPNGTKYIKLQRKSGSSTYVSQVCLTEGSPLPSCTTPILPDLDNKKVCPGEDVSWTANNTAELADGEEIAYQWTKKGNNTVLSNTATLTLETVTEAAGGTYVVTATVSADGKASATATKEVKLTVTPATATPAITASASTVFADNSVTLKATCASSGVTYQWYTCTDAEGTTAQIINNEENATLALTPDKAGTYYYKVIVTGDGTHSCGTAEKVYTLVVSNSGETTCGEIKGQFTKGVYTFDTNFIIYGINSNGNLETGASSSQGTICGGSGNYFGRQRFVVTFPVEVLSFSFIGYQANQRTVKAVKTTTDLKTADTEYTTITHTAEVSQEGNCQTHVITPETAIPANTFVWVELSNALNISEICYVPVSTADCTDPQVTATVNNVNNAIVCEGTENVTFTATNYADGTTTFQWQKKDGNTWTNINGAISATYTISSVTTAHAGKYRVIAEKNCKRISEEVTLTVLTAPTFNDFAKTASVMKGNALAISDVQATGATGYAWYKSSDNSLDAAADTKVGTSKDLLLAAASIPEAADEKFYLFCVASNSCGSVTSNAITVTVTELVEEECATPGNEAQAELFSFTNSSCSKGTYNSTPVWDANGGAEYLTYKTQDGKLFETAKVTIAHSAAAKAVYGYSTDGGSTWTYVETDKLTTDLTEVTIEFPEGVNAFCIGRNISGSGKGTGSGHFYLAEACFTYANTCTETTLTPSEPTKEYNLSVQMDFVEPTFTLKSGETTLTANLTYSSSNSEIATVDEEGNLTFTGMTGNVTITATYAGGTIDEVDYCACQGSYTITVGCKDAAPKIFAADGTNLDGCNASITLLAKMQDGNSFTEGTFQWYRDGVAIEGATGTSYEVVRAGTYTVWRTNTCTLVSTNSAVVTNENLEPEVERLTPFQYYHVDKTYSNQMKNRHLFAVTSYGTYEGKRYHLTATRNGETVDVSTSTAFSVITSQDNVVDTVMIDLNKLKGKYSEGDEIVITCTAVNSCNELSVINNSITIHVIDKTPVLALICSGAKADGTGTRVTAELTVGGDFLTGYNPADLCQQTSNTTFDPNTEWGFYTELKKNYIVVPVNGYAQFNKLNYEPFDVLLLTDYPKSSHSEAAQKIIDDMAELCDYRPLLSFKTHFQSANWAVNGEYKYNKWTKKGFVTAPVVPATTGTYVNIVCYAHPMFEEIQAVQGSGSIAFHDYDDHNQLVYEMLTGPGHESGKGIQGFELADANSFVTIGLVHYNATVTKVEVEEGGEDAGVGEGHHIHVQWDSREDDRLLVAIAERQANIEARMILFSINCGAQSLQTEGGRQVILECLQYLYDPDNDNPSLIEVADCHLTFDNGAGNIDFDEAHYKEHGGTGTLGDGLWTTAANWAPKYDFYPSANNEVRIAAPCTIDIPNAAAFSVQIVEKGKITINTDKALTVRSTITRYDKDNATINPTESEDIFIGSTATGNGTLIFNNDAGDTKATVEMYSTADADTEKYSAAASTWQYIGTPHSDVQNAANNYYESWLYQYNSTGESWDVIPNGGPLEPFRGYCITHPETPHTYTMTGTLTATTSHSAEIPAGKYVVIANSWTAPIQVANFEDDDFENIETKSIYLFNTGSDPKGNGTITPDADATQETRYAAGTYISIPIHSAPYTGDATISSMQGFYVVGGKTDGAVHLDYDKLVRPKEGQSIVGPPMHAPKRIAAQEQSPIVLKMIARGSRYDDNLFVLEREDFTRGYDSGWDGEEWGGSDVAPILYTTNENFIDQTVCAIPDMEGTLITFRAGEDSEYTIHFDYNEMAEALYLLDIDTQIYTRVLKGNSYTFTCADKKPHNRFILTRKAPQIATGTDHINTGENAKAVKFIKDEKMFIFMNGTLYDATGKIVIR